MTQRFIDLFHKQWVCKADLYMPWRTACDSYESAEEMYPDHQLCRFEYSVGPFAEPDFREWMLYIGCSDEEIENKLQ